MITRVIINKNIEVKFNKDLKRGLFKPEVQDLIEYWVTEIEDLAYEEYSKSDLYVMLNSPKLFPHRQGQLHITLNQTGGRLIYSVIKKTIVVKVVKITSDHDYS